MLMHPTLHSFGPHESSGRLGSAAPYTQKKCSNPIYSIHSMDTVERKIITDQELMTVHQTELTVLVFVSTAYCDIQTEGCAKNSSDLNTFFVQQPGYLRNLCKRKTKEVTGNKPKLCFSFVSCFGSCIPILPSVLQQPNREDTTPSAGTA